MLPLRQLNLYCSSSKWLIQVTQVKKLQHLPHALAARNKKLGYHTLGAIETTNKSLFQSLPYIQIRTQVRKAEEKSGKELAEAKDRPFAELSTAQKVKRAGTDATYSVIVIAGIAVTGALFFAIGRELFSGQSSYGIYNKALKCVTNHDDVIVACGEPIKGFAERTRRGRFGRVRGKMYVLDTHASEPKAGRLYEQHLSHANCIVHIVYEKDGFKRMRMKFYINGPDKGGTVHVEAQHNESGKYEFRYIFVELDEEYPRRTIIVEDNRASLSQPLVSLE